MATDLEVKSNFAHSSRVDEKSKIHGFGFSDTLATIEASGYFDPISDFLSVGDQISIKGSDGHGLYEITAVSPNVTISMIGGGSPSSYTPIRGGWYQGVPSNQIFANNDFQVYAPGISTAFADNPGEIIIANNLITYNSFESRLFNIHYTIKGSGAALNRIEFAIYKNGTIVAGSEMGLTVPSPGSLPLLFTGCASTLLSGGDIIQLYVRNLTLTPNSLFADNAQILIG